MQIINIELAHDYIRAGAALTGPVLLAVVISMSMTACSLFDSSPVREKVVQHPVAKNCRPLHDRQRR